MKLWLHPLMPLEEIREIRIERFPFVIGRRSDSDCALPFVFISRHHCQFTLADNQVMVQDLESHNGTFVNGKQAVSPMPVHHGDEVTVGPVSFRVVLVPALHETAESYRGLTDE